MKTSFRYPPVLVIVVLVCFSMLAGCKKEAGNTLNHLPYASFTVSPDRVQVNTIINFDSDSVSDFEDPKSVLQVRWDFDNNNIFETEYSLNKTTTHSYSAIGVYFPKLEVRDLGGMTDTIKKMVVVVSDLSNQPPDMPYYISPPNWQTWMEPTITFKWTCKDPENDPLSFDIWIGVNSTSMAIKKSGITTFTMVGLEAQYETTLSGFLFQKEYYWQIAARDIAGNYTPGRIWRFITRPE